MPKSTDVWSLIQQNPLRVYVHFHVFSLLIHIYLNKRLLNTLQHIQIWLVSYYVIPKKKYLILSAIKTSSFSRPKYTWSERSRLSLRSLHTFEHFGYYCYNDCVAFKTNCSLTEVLLPKFSMNGASQRSDFVNQSGCTDTGYKIYFTNI